MKAISRPVACIFVALTIGIAVISVSAAPDTNSWEDSVVTVFIEDGAESNSDVRSAILKLRSEPQSYRLEMMFMLTVDNYRGAELTGVEFDLNSLGTVVIKGNGTLKYDNGVYYAEAETYADRTGSVNFYVLLGVKDGYGDILNMDAVFFDSSGVRSNTYKAQINLNKNDDVGTSRSNQEIIEKAERSKTEKTKISSVKPSNGDDKNGALYDEPEASETILQIAEYDDTKELRKTETPESKSVISDGKKKVVLICALAAAVCFGAVAPLAVKFLKYKKY